MSPAVEKLKELEQRLVAADPKVRWWTADEADAWTTAIFGPKATFVDWGMLTAAFTSLDAAVALCERVLPGWQWSINTAEGGGYVVDIAPDGCPGGGPTVEHNATPALALLLAIVRAVLAGKGEG